MMSNEYYHAKDNYLIPPDGLFSGVEYPYLQNETDLPVTKEHTANILPVLRDIYILD